MQHFHINVLLYVYIFLLTTFVGVLPPPGCDIWFPRPGHNGSASTPSEAELQKPVRLYNIEKDPEERNEVSAQFPAVVDRLLARLYHHQKSAAPINFPDDDPKCDPGPAGAWGPWTWMVLFTGFWKKINGISFLKKTELPYFLLSDNHNWKYFFNLEDF